MSNPTEPHDHPPGPTRTPAPAPSSRAPRSRSLREALHARPSRGQLVSAVLLAVLGLAATLQVRDNGAEDDDLTGARQADLIALINSLTLATERARVDIEQLTTTRDDLLGTAENSTAALEAAREQEEVWAILAGTIPVKGPGVRVEVESAGQVGTDQIVNGLQELRDAGAEAIELNDRVRVAARTAVASRPDGEGIVVDGEPLSPPYVIDAIGDPQTLASALDFFGGFISSVEEVGGRVRVEQESAVEIVSVRELSPLRYARPTGEE